MILVCMYDIHTMLTCTHMSQIVTHVTIWKYRMINKIYLKSLYMEPYFVISWFSLIIRSCIIDFLYKWIITQDQIFNFLRIEIRIFTKSQKLSNCQKHACIILMSRRLYRQNNGSLFSGVFELFDCFLYLYVWFVHVLSNGHSPEKCILRYEGFAPDQYGYRTHASSAGILL